MQYCLKDKVRKIPKITQKCHSSSNPWDRNIKGPKVNIL